MADCIFCKIVSGEIPGDVVYEDEHVLAFRDIQPVAPTHILFIPKNHYQDFLDASAADGVVDSVFKGISAYVEKAGLDKRDIRIVSNCGEKAGQSVFHWHVHVLSGRGFQWPPG